MVRVAGSLAAASIAASCASGAIVFVTQERFVEAESTCNGEVQLLAANDFGAFSGSVEAVGTFQGPQGPAINRGIAGISCTFELGRIAASGTLAGEGGFNVSLPGGGNETGRGRARVELVFDVPLATPFHLIAPRIDPTGTNGTQGDDYRFRLVDVTNQATLFESEPANPVSSVDIEGVFQPGRYLIRYDAEVRSTDVLREGFFDFELLVPAPGTLCVGGVGVLLLARRRR